MIQLTFASLDWMTILKALSLLWPSGGHHLRLTDVVEASVQVNDCTGNGFVITHSNTGCLK